MPAATVRVMRVDISETKIGLAVAGEWSAASARNRTRREQERVAAARQ